MGHAELTLGLSSSIISQSGSGRVSYLFKHTEDRPLIAPCALQDILLRIRTHGGLSNTLICCGLVLVKDICISQTIQLGQV
jgi:hypothetical protein